MFWKNKLNMSAFNLFSWISSLTVAKIGLELTILLFLPLQWWNYMCVSVSNYFQYNEQDWIKKTTKQAAHKHSRTEHQEFD